MPRKRHGTIQESLQQLGELRRQYTGREKEPRIRMLQILREDESRTMAQTATLIRCSERSVRRWWNVYRAGGIAALLAEDDARLQGTLQRAHERYTPPLSGVHALPGYVCDFLNALALMADPENRVTVLREALRAFLGDVDRITINVDIHTEHEGEGKEIVRAMADSGFPFHEYHPPLVYDYHTSNDRYSGSIILWREVLHVPVSVRTVQTMTRLQPFLAFLLSDCAARCSQSKSDLGIATGLVGAIEEREGSTTRRADI